MENTSLLPYQQLFELDELLVEILRHLLDDKKSINQLLLTAKWLSKRLHSTALWTSVGILFYNHNENIITSQMLWHLLRDRRIQLFKPPIPHQESSEALKYLIHLARLETEARYTMSFSSYQSLFYELLKSDQRPYMQELACVLLREVYNRLPGDLATDLRKYVPGIVAIIKGNEEHIGQSSLVLAACKLLEVFGSSSSTFKHFGMWVDVLRNLTSLGPIITKLMTHGDPDLQASGYSVAVKLTTGFEEEQEILTSLPGFWTTVIEGLSSKLELIRKKAALILSNLIADGDSPYLAHVNTEEVFRALLALRSDAPDVKLEVIWTFINLADSHYKDMNEAQKQLWHTYYSEMLDYCTAQLQDFVDAAAQLLGEQKGVYEDSSLKAKEGVVSDTLLFIGSLLDIMEDLPNKETVRENLIRSNLAHLLQSPLLPYSMKLDEIRDILFHNGEDEDSRQQIAETDPNYNNGLFVL